MKRKRYTVKRLHQEWWKWAERINWAINEINESTKQTEIRVNAIYNGWGAGGWREQGKEKK